MPNITKHFHIDITPEQFLKACSLEELQELDLLLDSYLTPGFKEAHDQLEKVLNEQPIKCRECGFSRDTMISKDLCARCWEGLHQVLPVAGPIPREELEYFDKLNEHDAKNSKQ